MKKIDKVMFFLRFSSLIYSANQSDNSKITIQAKYTSIASVIFNLNPHRECQSKLQGGGLNERKKKKKMPRRRHKRAIIYFLASSNIIV